MDAYDKVTVDGETLDRRTADALAWADRRFRDRFPKARLQVGQGSYEPGFGPSAGTHDRGGVIDVRTVPLTGEQAKFALKQLKKAGFAAWLRDERDGMSPHIHAVMLEHRNLAPVAAAQAVAYVQGRNGLANNARDRNPWRPDPLVKFNWRKGRPVPL